MCVCKILSSTKRYNETRPHIQVKLYICHDSVLPHAHVAVQHKTSVEIATSIYSHITEGK